MSQASHGPLHFTGPSREMFAGSLALFASVMMIIIGLFHIVVGLAAVLQRSFYVVAEHALPDEHQAGSSSRTRRTA